MKYLLLASLLFVGIGAFAQDTQPALNLPVKDGLITYEKIVEVPGKDKGDIYLKALDWYFKAFPGDKNELDENDVNLGQLAGQSKFDVFLKASFGMTATYNIKCNVTIDCKDGKYRCRFTNFQSMYGEKVSDADLFSKTPTYEPLENELAISTGQKKGNKSQIKFANQKLLAVDTKVNRFIDDLNAYINKKAADF